MVEERPPIHRSDNLLWQAALQLFRVQRAGLSHAIEVLSTSPAHAEIVAIAKFDLATINGQCEEIEQRLETRPACL